LVTDVDVQIIFDVIGVEAKGVKALTTHANSPKAKLHPNRCKDDTTRTQTRRDKVANKPSPERKPPLAHASQERCYA
jgi:hypothetical protein